MKKKNRDLILAVQAGDEEAFEKLYDSYYRLVFFIAYELCKNNEDAKDIAQETFMQIKKSICSLKEIDNFNAWLNRVTINKCKNFFRASKTVNFDMDNSFFQNTMVEERNYMLPVENMHLENDKNVLHSLMSRLPLVQREVLLLRFFENLSMKDMAYILDIPEGTVKTRLLYGKDNLKKMVQEYEDMHKIKVNFHGDAAIASLFTSAFATLHMSKTMPFLAVKKHNFFGSSVVSTSIGKVAVVSALLTTGGIGTIAYQQVKRNNEGPLLQPAIESYNNTYARIYYFELLNWASCEQDMRAKSDDEIASVEDVYSKLKQSNTAYYKRLTQDDWTFIYEELLENSKK